MGLRITEVPEAVLYDSTTGTAFGQVFKSYSDAQEFLDWLEEGELRDRKFDYQHDRLLFKKDARIYRDHELEYLHQLWMQETERGNSES